MLNQLQDQLIVSCQPVKNSPLDKPEVVAALAQAAISGGAGGLRIEGVENLQAVRVVTGLPIIALRKHSLADSPVRISPFLSDVRDLMAVGADIIAFDATRRRRPVAVQDLIREIHHLGGLAMADCADVEDARGALAAGADLIGSTLSGYTGGETPAEPDYDLVRALRGLNSFVVAEGRYHRPDQAQQALEQGADAIVVGSAITRPEHVTSWFVSAVRQKAPGEPAL